MQPSMSETHHNHEHVQPSNDEIEILYDVVRQAQNLPETSADALFQAYDTVLKERGIDSSNDTIMYDVLLRMQEDEREPNFVQRFQRVLGGMGIQVECDSDGEGIEDTSAVQTTTRNGEPPLQTTNHIPSRRGSFDSFFDGAADKVAGTDTHDIPFRSRHGSRDKASDAGGRREKRRSRSDTEAQVRIFGQLPIRNGVNGHGHRRIASEQIKPLPPHRRGSGSTRRTITITRNGHTESRHPGDYDGDESEQTDYTDSFDADNVRIPGVNAPIPRIGPPMVPETYRPSDTQMLDDAEIFEHQREHALARLCIKRWRDRTQDQIDLERERSLKAFAHDRRALLRAAMSSWHATLQNRRQDIETERFFSRLEKRAEKARNLFLLTKAFTHWNTTAEDEVQRTSVARRHILRTKYFGAWREITAVNEMKIQHFVLSRFLNKWRARTAVIRDQSELATTLSQNNLAAKTFQRWFMNFLDRQAPSIWQERLKRKIFGVWRETSAVVQEKENWATNRRDGDILRRTLESLRQKASTIRSQEEQADAFRQRTLLSSAFHIIRKEAQLAPLLAQFTARVDIRIVQTAFRTWHRNLQFSRQARHVDQTRILRNAFTAWNDRLRTKQIVDRINDRVLIEAMYKWALASRVSLYQRVHDRKLKESAMSTWIARTQERSNTLEFAERRFAQFKRAQLLRSCLQNIETATVARKSQEYLALSVYEPKLKQRMFDKMREKLAHIQELQGWSRNARFYVLTTNTLKIWNQATQQSRRNRRRETYTHVRRMVKMNLVRRMFGTWRDKSAQVTILDGQAAEVVENRVLQTSTSLLNQWRDRTTHIRDLDAQATQILNTRLTSMYLSTWTQHFQQLQTLNTQAVALRQETAEIAASSCLKKLGWRLFNVQRQEETALALHQRNFEKHLRAMIRFWFEQTVERAAQRPVSPTPSSRHRADRSHRDDSDDDEDDDHGNGSQRRRGGGDDDGGTGGGNAGFDDASQSSHSAGDAFDEGEGDDTRRLEAWTAFDENALLAKDIDLSLSFSPRNPNPHRPQTHPQLRSAQKPRPSTILEDVEEDDPFAHDNPTGLWTSTPMPPTIGKPGYLKTPSKRSVVRGKRPELPASPEKRPTGILQRGAMSAPPGILRRDADMRGVTSFERRLREGGVDFGTASSRKDTGTGRRGRGIGPRVGFGDVSRLG